MRAKLSSLCDLLSKSLLTLLRLLDLGNPNGGLPLLLNLTTHLLVLLSLPFCELTLQTISFLLKLTLTKLLALLLFKVTDEALAGDVLAFEAFPNTVWHALKVCAKQMIWFLTATTINEIARILALETVVRVL